MIHLGRLEGRVKVAPSIEVGMLVWEYEDRPEPASLIFKLELFKAYPVAVNP